MIQLGIVMLAVIVAPMWLVPTNVGQEEVAKKNCEKKYG